MSRRDGQRCGRQRPSRPSLWSPRAIAGLGAWYRGDMGITIATGVSAWADQSGSGDSAKTLAQATGTAQPTYNAADAAYAGRPTLTFTAASSQALASGTWATAPAVAGCTFFLVGQTGGLAAQEVLFDSISAARMLLDNNVLANGLRFLLSGGVTTTATLSAKNVVVVQCVAGSTSTAVYVSAKTALVTGVSPGTSAPTGLTLGGAFNATGFLNGKLAEFGYFNRVLSGGEVNQLLAYAGTRYAITIGA